MYTKFQASISPGTINAENSGFLPIVKWTKKWCIKLNYSKTVHVLHSLMRVQYDLQSVITIVGNHNKTSHRYLGVQMDDRLLLMTHFNNVVGKLRTRSKELNWLIDEFLKLNKILKI